MGHPHRAAAAPRRLGARLGPARVGLGHLYAPGTGPTATWSRRPFEDNLLTSDPEMYAYMRRQVAAEPNSSSAVPPCAGCTRRSRNAGCSRAAPRRTLPCLAFVGSNERIVDVARIRARMAHWPGGTLEVIEGGEHEVLMDRPAVRAQITSAIAAHFTRSADKHRRAESA